MIKRRPQSAKIGSRKKLVRTQIRSRSRGRYDEDDDNHVRMRTIGTLHPVQGQQINKSIH